MSEKILMKIAETAEIKKCPLTGKLFETEPDKPAFYLNDVSIHPDYARTTGYEISPGFKLPESVTSKQKLTAYLMGIGLRQDDKQYLELYELYSPVLPMGNNF